MQKLQNRAARVITRSGYDVSAKHLLISLRQPRSQGLSRAGEKETLVGAGHVSQTKKVDRGMGTSVSTVCNFFFFCLIQITRRHVSQQSAFFRHDEQLFGL